MPETDTAPAALRPRLAFARYLEQIERQAGLLSADLAGLTPADLGAPVPSCPGWNLAQLTQHVGEELPWVEGMVRTRATTMADDTAMRQLDPAAGRDGDATGAWIVEGARALTATMRDAGPSAAMWTPVPGSYGVGFFARRFAHEGALHRADAALALGRPEPLALDDDLAVDALAEWMELAALPVMLEYHPHRRELLGAGRTLRWEATDVTGPDATWLVDLTGEVPAHRPGTTAPAAATARGPVLDVLAVLYRRSSVAALGVDGDRGLLEEWLAANAFA